MKIKNIYFLQYLLLVYFSLFFFRGRLGSDDLEVFNLVIAFKQMDLNFFDFVTFLSDNFRNEKLFLELYTNTNSLPDYKTLHVRYIWVLQTYIIVSILDLLSLSQENFMFLSQYFSGLIISFYTCISFLILNKYFQKTLNINHSILLSIFIFFGTGLISFFTGSYIESLIILLIISRHFIKNRYLIFLIDYFILLIKPYYYLILVSFSFINLNRKNFIKALVNPLVLFFAVLITRQLLFDVNYDQYTKDYSNFGYNLYFIINNFYDQLFSFGYGVFYTSLIPILLIFFGYQKNQTIYKILGVLLLVLFLSLFKGNHGQVPGGRYFLPVLFIFLNEFVLGFSVIIKKYNKIFYILILLTIFNLPTLEYRNFSLPQYISNASTSGISPKILGNNMDHDYPLRKFYFNHSIFANKVLLSKIINKELIILGDSKLNTSSIYPMSGLARILYIIETDNKTFIKKIPKIFIKLKFLLKTIYITTYLFLFCYLIYLIKNKKRSKD